MRQKHALWLRIHHWINAPLLSMMIYSGFLIYWANPAYEAYGFFPDKFYQFFHLDRQLAFGMAIHFTIMWLLMINGLFYMIYLFSSKHWRELFPNKKTFGDLIPTILHDLRIIKTAPAHGTFNAAQRFAYTGAIVLVIIELLSGFAIYKPVQLSFLLNLFGSYKSARLVHFVCMISLCLFIFTHLIQVCRAGWNNFQAMVTGVEHE